MVVWNCQSRCVASINEIKADFWRELFDFFICFVVSTLTVSWNGITCTRGALFFLVGVSGSKLLELKCYFVATLVLLYF